MTQRFSANEMIPNRPFAAREHSQHDLSIMNRMLRQLRQHIPLVIASTPLETYNYNEIKETDGTLHRIVLPNWPLLMDSHSVTAVGFFGQARLDVDHTPIMDLENEIIDNMGDNPGLLVYYNAYWPQIGWGNLVLFSNLASKEDWPERLPHPTAVDLTPNHYFSIRLHTAALSGRLLGEESIHLVKTKYLDFNDAVPWIGVREY